MLSTSRRSRRRLVAGSALVSTLVLAGLGLTVSGTSAAAALSGKVGDALGVPMQQDVAPEAPEVPDLGPVPPVPAMPPMAKVDTMPATAAKPHRVIVKRVAKDGSVSTYTSTKDGSFEDRDVQVMVDRAMAAAPQVRSGRCADGAPVGDRQMVVDRESGGKRVMVICTNRIQAMAASATHAAVDTGAIRRNALSTALASLAASRADLAANRDMPASERAKALADMDAAVVELRGEMASRDED